MPTTRTRLAPLAPMAAAALLAAGCLPNRVVIDLAPSADRLSERQVDADRGAGSGSPKVALIHVEGFLADFARPGLFGEGANPVDELVSRLRNAAADPQVRAVVLRINSPGGTVTGSDTMHREVRRFVEVSGKPVVASMGEVAASGGYYLALAADEIFAQPTTITGSVGVVLQTVNFSRGLEMIGIRARALTSGPNKDIANPFEPEVERHYEILQGIVDEHYARFRKTVLDRRPGLSATQIDTATDGRVVTGDTAAGMGLVDHVGGVHDAFDAAKRLAGVKTARLIAYASPGRAPGTMYAPTSHSALGAAAAGAGRPDGGLTLMEINLPQWPQAGGFYYLWAP